MPCVHKKKCHPKFLTNFDGSIIMLSLHFFSSIFEGVFGVRDRNSIDAYVCVPEDARTHLQSDCLAVVFQAHGRALWQFHREQGERGGEREREWSRLSESEVEGEREGEGGSLPSQPGSLSAYTIFQLNLRLSNVGYAARVSSIFHKRSAISCFGTHGALTDTHTVSTLHIHCSCLLPSPSG